MLLLNILKDLLNLAYNGKCETELRKLFSSDLSMVTAWYMPKLVTSNFHHWTRIWHLRFRWNQNKEFTILTETHINLDQIHHIRNNWLGAIFLLLEKVTQKDCLSCFILVLNVIPSNDRVLSVYASSGNNTREQLARGHFFEWLQNYMKKKRMEMKTKEYLEILIRLFIKLTGMVEINHKEFIDVVPVILYQNSSWIMGSNIYGEGRTQIPLSLTTMINHLAQDTG